MWPVLISTLSATLGQFSDQLIVQDPALLQNVAAAQVETTDPIHVRIYPHLANYLPEDRDLDSTQVTLTSTTPCNVYFADPNKPASLGALSSTETTMSFVANTMTQAFWIECTDPLTVIRGPAASIKSYSYTGPFYVHALSEPAMSEADGVTFAARKVVEVVEIVPVETYLRGVVASEMPHTWPLEALKTQAIAARTYGLFHMQLAKAQGNVFYDVDDTTLYQAFTGVNGQAPETDQAIALTEGQIITYQDAVIQAFFSASAGGYTEDASAIWSTSLPYCQAKPETFVDPNLDNGDYAPWKVTMSLKEITSELLARQYIPPTSPITKIEILSGQTDGSGRAKSVHLTFQDHSTFDVSGSSFQKCLGLRSTLLSFTQNDEVNVIIDGKGFGHGVGMSQYGAQVYAQTLNWNAEEILNFYYTGVQIGAPTALVNSAN
jgi:SpoIID/LytB domain protein